MGSFKSPVYGWYGNLPYLAQTQGAYYIWPYFIKKREGKYGKFSLYVQDVYKGQKRNSKDREQQKACNKKNNRRRFRKIQ